MDIEGPPPFSGTFEEPLDTSGHRIPLGDDEDDSNVGNYELDIPIPNDISFQIPSPIPSAKKDNPPAPGVDIEQVKQEDIPITNGIHENSYQGQGYKECNIEKPLCSPKLARNIVSNGEDIASVANSEEESRECSEEAGSDDSKKHAEDISFTQFTTVDTLKMEDTKPANGPENDSECEFGDFTDNGASTASVSKQLPEVSAVSETVEKGESMTDDFGDDDFGDFADFAPVNPATTSADDDDEWGDFDATPRTSRQASIRQESVEDDDGFGAFGTVASAAPTRDEPEDDWAADFKQAPAPTQPEEPIVTEKEFPSLEKMEMASVWDLSEDEDHENESKNAICITAEFDCDTVEDTNLDSEDIFYKSAQLWHSLRIVEDTLALTFEWELSRMNKNYLKYLEIDQNVTPKTQQTLSASNVLVPTSVSLSAGSTSVLRTSEKSSSSSSTTLNPNLGNEGSNKENGSASVSPLRATTPECSSTINIDSLSAPPADFDWNTSGLTNPLKGGSHNSSLLDVDFLSLNSGTAVNSISTLQRDLDAFGLSTPSTSDNNRSQQSVLDKILANTAAAVPKHNYKQSSELSLDAGALHARLPEISYLRSKTIMFPIGGINRPEGQ